MIRSRFVQVRWLFLLAALLLAACGGAPANDGIASAWAGEIEGTDVFVGIASNGHEVMAYICDGDTISQWFHGEEGIDNLDLNAGTADLSAGGARFQAQLTQETATGTVTLADGQTFNFTAGRASGDAGLYRLEETVNNEQLITGWVVLPSGELRGVQVNMNTQELQPQTNLNNLAKLLDPTIARY